jgi:parallel beta-helix repeat protein
VSAREAAAVTNIDSCRTITQSGSYRLIKNLQAEGDCLIVAADFVTIDLNGHTIAGNGTGRGVTDLDQERHGIVVRNGTITNFRSEGVPGGVILRRSIGSVVERLRVINNDVGIEVGRGSIVSGNIASGNRVGILALQEGNTVTGNVATDNDFGIEIRCPNNVIGNTMTNNKTQNLATGLRSDCNLRDNVAP